MVPTRSTIAAVFSVITAAGCTTTRPPVEYPGLVESGTPHHRLAIVRESDHCFVASVGEHYITQYGVNPLSPGTYRQLLLPPGKHVLAIHYRHQRNLETVLAGPRLVTLDVQPGQIYELRSGAHGVTAWFADTLPTANWRPHVVHAPTGHVVATANLNNQ